MCSSVGGEGAVKMVAWRLNTLFHDTVDANQKGGSEYLTFFPGFLNVFFFFCLLDWHLAMWHTIHSECFLFIWVLQKVEPHSRTFKFGKAHSEGSFVTKDGCGPIVVLRK
jgi:hypothetical protein